ncbi:C-factor-like [Rhincodon typus]|uniref:C-factor-like n=1 Tax=Rhincodon typus TaxID=259920 RepID=UPI00202EED51|nr:C-factor-like [Rhincodon typus]
MTTLKAQSVLVTGANKGIGLELVKQLINSSVPPTQILATFWQSSSTQELETLANDHSSVRMIELDVTDSASIQRAVERVEAILGSTGLNLLINNAGINSHATLETITAEDMMAVYQTNVVGPLLVSQAFLPLLKKAAQALDMKEMSCKKAAIVNITSLLGSITLSQKNFRRAPMYPYRLSKAALNMASMCLSEDLKQYQILSVAIHPGWVQTDMGGKEALVSVSDSVSNLMKLFASLSQCDTGKFLDSEGGELPW